MNSMPDFGQAACPRCRRPFDCRADHISQCQCRAVELTDAHRQYVRSRYQTCLCADCLTALRTEHDAQVHPQSAL